MRVWLIQTGESVPLSKSVKRIRTALLASELASRGHQVVWWASSFDHGSRQFMGPGGSTHLLNDGVEVRLLPALGYRKNVSLRRYLDHRYVARCFKKELQENLENPDLIVAATPDYHIAGEAGAYAVRMGIPYVVDLRDVWPDSVVEALPGGPIRILRRVALSGDFRKLRKTIPRATGLVGMMQSMLEWGLGYAERLQGPNDRVFYLGTEPLPKADASFVEDLKGRLGTDEYPTVIYIGTFGRFNHPEVLLSAVERICEETSRPPFNVVIGGEGDLYGAIRRKYENLPGVHFTGWLTPPKMASVLSIADLGVVPWASGIAFPNKAFSYLEAGLPLVHSASGDLQQIGEEEGFAEFFEPGNAKMLAERLLRLSRDPATLSAMSERALRTYTLRFRSDAIYHNYADYLESIENSR